MVEAVPAFWIFEDSGGYKCRWPDIISGAKVRAAIRAKENWKSIPVEILSSSPYDHFYVATKKAGNANGRTQLIIPNINSDLSTPRTASFTAAKQKCLTCKDSTKIIRLLHIINGRVTQNAELITAILNSRNENNIQDNNPSQVLP
ncbi:hypothetical protein JTB14_003193 [Gonioctena quinquepunctata]|nr:hypothetical protein JTB14_003193 [Gonioctena quinquepunctata]